MNSDACIWRNQRGISMIGFLFVTGVLLVVALLGLDLAPFGHTHLVAIQIE